MSVLDKIKELFSHTQQSEHPAPAETATQDQHTDTSTTPEASPPIHADEPSPPSAPHAAPVETVSLHHKGEFSAEMLAEILATHRTWLSNLEAALRGQNPSIYKTKLASDDRLSELGKWLYHNDTIFTPYPEYHMLLDMNKRFHECAGEVVEHHRNGRFADAILLLRRDLSLLSEEVQKSLINLHKQVQEKGEKICE